MEDRCDRRRKQFRWNYWAAFNSHYQPFAACVRALRKRNFPNNQRWKTEDHRLYSAIKRSWRRRKRIFMLWRVHLPNKIDTSFVPPTLTHKSPKELSKDARLNSSLSSVIYYRLAILISRAKVCWIAEAGQVVWRDHINWHRNSVPMLREKAHIRREANWSILGS